MTDVRPLGRGLDHVALLVGGDTVVRVALERDPAVRAAAVRREETLLRAVAGAVMDVSPSRSPSRPTSPRGTASWRIPSFPAPRWATPTRRPRARVAEATGALLGRLMATVAGLTPHLREVVEFDDDPPAAWLVEARVVHPRLVDEIPAAHRAAVRAFLDEPPLAAAPRGHLVLCHDDLGAEHVLVDDDGTVTGVIDWSDAAVADPAGDLGRISATWARVRWTPPSRHSPRRSRMPPRTRPCSAPVRRARGHGVRPRRGPARLCGQIGHRAGVAVRLTRGAGPAGASRG